MSSNVHPSPVVSVIIPVFNRAHFILDTVASALKLRDFPIEVVVVDDASTDDSWTVVNSISDPRVRCFRLSANSGQCAARNHGIDVAKGRYLKYLDSDDTLSAEHLREEVSLALSSMADVVVSGWTVANMDGVRTDFPAPVFTNAVDDLLAGMAVPVSAALYSRDLSVRWNESFRKLDDWDYICRAILAAGKVVPVPGSAFVYVQHGGPRATGEGMLRHAIEHHGILHMLEAELERTGRLTHARRQRLAQYYYKELRVLCVHDRNAFEAALHHIIELDPDFAPRDEERQPLMRLAARVFGTRNSVLAHTALKKLIAPVLRR